MKFGTHLYPYWQFHGPRAIRDYVCLAEEAGFSYVSIPQHTVFPRQYEESIGREWWDPFVLAAYLADATTKITMQFDIIILPQNDPFAVAKQLATLDRLFDGRVALGVAPGWMKVQYEILGADWAHRGRILEEQVRLLRTLWSSDDECSFDGTIASFVDVSFHPKPARPAGPPIYIGGSVDASVRRAAELGDGWLPMPCSWSKFVTDLALLQQHFGRLGRSMDGYAIFRTLPLFGVPQDAEAHIEMAGGTSFGEVIEGDYDKAAEYVDRCADLGVSHMSVVLPRDDDATSIRELERFSELARRYA